ncbi:transcription termination/antitermination protein NusG [Rubinisphaera sp.]|uniref:transcription termination/antitermination protein NusG n=1 Tax=Rubinisphaera sp. TaxID=2024857 RepID=UPI000C0EBB62|nr:transcription termination/antitermination protein NusG [Rubinisphaera sp.]MBV11707.1 transcription termination/antitermination factor NusG [Rubinisphaera sp.]|tara:strand:- start:6623 stop:7222 length:600 start_codon:yes stop_codon:yes gene_type:complete
MDDLDIDNSKIPSRDDEAASGKPDMLWYVLKVQSNRERTIRDALLRRIKRDHLEEYFGEIIIPTEKIVETKSGKKRVREQRLYPGYVMIQMILNDDSWYLVRDTGGVGDFTGSAGKPIPMREEEIIRMLGQEETKAEEPTKVKINLGVGDTVKIGEGTFESFEGSIEAIDDASGKISVLIEIFGRPTPVELEHWQVEKV